MSVKRNDWALKVLDRGLEYLAENNMRLARQQFSALRLILKELGERAKFYRKRDMEAKKK